MTLGINILIKNSNSEALKAAAPGTLSLWKKYIAALSRIPKSPMAMGSIDFTIIVAPTARNAFETTIDEKALTKSEN